MAEVVAPPPSANNQQRINWASIMVDMERPTKRGGREDRCSLRRSVYAVSVPMSLSVAPETGSNQNLSSGEWEAIITREHTPGARNGMLRYKLFLMSVIKKPQYLIMCEVYMNITVSNISYSEQTSTCVG